MDELLRKATVWCFGLTGFVLLVFALGWWILRDILAIHPSSETVSLVTLIMSVATFVAGFLPAAGAALAGIRETGDFHGFAHRSARTVTALENIASDLPRAKREVLLDDAGDILVRTAQVLTEDLAAWQSLYSAKRLNLPV
jgi:hypothetical protein